MIEKGRLGVLSSLYAFSPNIPPCAEYITRAQREYHLGNAIDCVPKYHILPMAKYITAILATSSCQYCNLWGLVKFHIGGKVRARLLNG